MVPGHLGLDAEQGLPELVDDSGAAQLGEGIRGRTRSDDRTVGHRLGRSVMVGDDDVEATLPCLGHLGRGRDSTVDREDEPATVVGQAGERLTADAVALVEATRQMPGDIGAKLAQEEDGEGCGGDSVDVVVAVDANPAALVDGGADPGARGRHVTEEEWVVRGQLSLEELCAAAGSE